MPHIDVRMFPGRDDETKKALAEKIVEVAMVQLGCAKEALSVAIEDVEQGEWNEQVADTVDESKIVAGEVYRVK